MKLATMGVALLQSFAFAVDTKGEMPSARVQVDAASVLGELNSNIYGQQIEFMGPCIDGGLWAELLRNRKFGVGDDNGDGVSDEWQRAGKDAKVSFSLDTADAFCLPHSQRIDVEAAAGTAFAGVQQPGVATNLGQKYVGYAWLRGEGEGKLRIGLGPTPGSLYCFAEVGPLTTAWKRHDFEFTGPVTDTTTAFQILSSAPGTYWLGPVSLMTAENENGLQHDVLESLRQTRPPHMRWPGGCYADHYHFEQALGPRDKRPMRYDTMWLAWSPNDFGTDEFIAFCREMGAEPSITLNVRTGTPEEAAHWVEYCNGAADTPYGKKRAENGHPEPYRVKYFSIGNESWDYATAAEYAEKVKLFAPAVRAVDPSIILTAVGHDLEWDRTVLEDAGEHFDWLSQHYYFPTVWAKDIGTDEELTTSILLQPQILETSMKGVAALIDEIGAKKNKRWDIAMDEWNVWPANPYLEPMVAGTAWGATRDATLLAVIKDLQRNFALREGLHACGIFNMLYRQSGPLTSANVFTSCNELGIFRTDGQRSFPTPVHLAFDLYRNHSGKQVVLCKSESPRLKEFGEGDAKWGLDVLDAVATHHPEQGRLFVHLVNRSLDSPVHVVIELTGFAPKGEATAHVLSAASWTAENSFSHPSHVVLLHEPLALGTDTNYQIPPHTAVILEFRS